MTSDVAHGETPLTEVSHPLPAIGPRQYVIIGAILAVITGVELWVSYSSLGDLIIPVLIVLSAVKFVTVVAFFMHLRFDSKFLTRVFVFGFVLASALLLALISLFWNDATLPAAPLQESPAEASSGEAAGAGASAAAEVTLDVALAEFQVTSAAESSAGVTTFEVKNDGAVPHNLRVIRTDLAPNALPVAGGAVDETQVDVVASVAELAGDASGSAKATLEAGTYVLICNVPGHYQLGMTTQLIVQ